MRYEGAEKLLRLCVMMAARSQGVSLNMIEQEFEVKRRTAERMRDAALRLLPSTHESIDEQGYKYWRATDIPKGLITNSTEDFNTLSAAAQMMETSNRPDGAASLLRIREQLLASQSKHRQYALETDLELLMQSEGLALRPGPRIKLSVSHIETIREAILASSQIKVSYTKRHQTTARDVILEPYGLLYGQRPYLIAKQAGKPEVRHYRLQGLENVTLTNTAFNRDEDFELAQYGRRLFGVFNEEPFDVCWRFTPKAAGDAAEYVFHPDQKHEWQTDGSLDVKFRAAGAQEMAWHLMTWGDAVKVLEPANFWQKLER